MSYCPSCHTEYGSWVESCAICKTGLVDSLPHASSENESEATELVELAAFPNVSEAEMIREIMEKNGLRTVQRGEADPIGVVSGAEPVTLLIEEKDIQCARELYEAYFSGNDIADSLPDPE
jgi:hypothetical protein